MVCRYCARWNFGYYCLISYCVNLKCTYFYLSLIYVMMKAYFCPGYFRFLFMLAFFFLFTRANAANQALGSNPWPCLGMLALIRRIVTNYKSSKLKQLRLIALRANSPATRCLPCSTLHWFVSSCTSLPCATGNSRYCGSVLKNQ